MTTSKDVEPALHIDIPKTVKSKKPLPVHEFPVEHDHTWGSCRGTLKVTPNTLSYISENEKCSFEFSYDEINVSLDGERLRIKTKSKRYHFKSIDSPAEGEKHYKIEEIFKTISQSKS